MLSQKIIKLLLFKAKIKSQLLKRSQQLPSSQLKHPRLIDHNSIDHQEKKVSMVSTEVEEAAEVAVEVSEETEAAEEVAVAEVATKVETDNIKVVIDNIMKTVLKSDKKVESTEKVVAEEATEVVAEEVMHPDNTDQRLPPLKVVLKVAMKVLSTE